MADKSEWKTPSMEREGRWTPIRAKAQDTRANPNSRETHLVRKRWDIGHLRALSIRIMMMMMMIIHEARLFRSVRCDSRHVLKKHLPPPKVHKYNLRMRPHNLTLPPKDDRNFIARQLYKNIY